MTQSDQVDTDNIPLSVWLAVAGAAVAAGALMRPRRSGSTVAGLRSLLDSARHDAADYGPANNAAGDGPHHIYPNDAIGLGQDNPNQGRMVWHPDSPGSSQGTIEWSVTPGGKITSSNLQVNRNGQPVTPNYKVSNDGRTMTGSIRANAGDTIDYDLTGTMDGPNKVPVPINIDGTVEPIREPVAGQTDGGPGVWVRKNESMSANSAYYQEAVTHVKARDWTYRITRGADTADYDGFYIDRSGQQWLLEAKGHYSSLVDPSGNAKPWGAGLFPSARGQFIAQDKAAKGTGARMGWYLQEPSTQAFFNNAAQAGGATAVTFFPSPAGRSN
ncbi:hypothetical protein HH308_24160 [Gordonia sp. TBRC 11910]|uniref:Tox-REase-5 domain-containing protein n=1 Tax=Gordonia asplenii TaxID=2725283 RepID=A0A848L9R2_9ACTN|nr:Tox-REase-5 domain-containing protein [Gordonia asplenii]NMO04318.1 hypothetical protein [Gordonia asplenii]